MKTPARRKKWLNILLVLVLLLVAAGGILLYVAKYRIRDILQIVVSRESKGVYGFNASSVDISFLGRHIVVKDAVLFCNDTLHTSPHYDVKVPELYLAIQSWREVIFHKKVSVDSISVFEPVIKSHEHFAKKTKPITFGASTITEGLEKLLQQLQVRSFNMQNASFVITRYNAAAPLSVNQVSLSVRNFSKRQNAGSRLFSSDDIDLTMAAQHWLLPDGNHDISFKKLHFSGKNQFFELDSFSFRAAPVQDKGQMSFSAEKLFFNSQQLTALYEQDALLIDTLICFRPVLNMETTSKNSKQPDSTASVGKSLANLFTNIHFNYIDVKDGELSIVNRYRPNYITQKANLKAYNLHIGQDSLSPITSDSIQLNLQNLAFLTTDSLFQMTVAEFAMHNNDVVFKNAVYTPTARNQADKGFTFATPSLHLKNINLAALMSKKLVADTAELYRPVITVFDKGKAKNPAPGSATAPAKNTVAKKKNFYQTLHGLNELIAVQHFNIINGSLGFTSAGAAKVQMAMKNLDASILLARLFRSDSLIDIKRSLPQLSAGQITVQSPNLNLAITNYVFKGDRRHNRADQVQLSLANGTHVSGKKLYWEIFDWDMYANHKIILIEYLRLGELFVNIRKKGEPAPAKESKDLPELHIARFDLDQLHFSDSSAKSTVAFNASGICADNIGTRKKFFTWNNAEGLFTNLVFNGSKAQTVSVNKVILNTQYGTILNDAKLDMTNDKGYTRVSLPVTKIKTAIHSTDFAAIHLNVLETDNANIDIYKKQPAGNETAVSKPLTMPVALNADRLLVKKARVKYTAESATDTLALTAGMSIDAEDLTTRKNQKILFNYNTATIGLSDLTVNKGKFDLSVPQSSVSLTNGSAEENAEGKIMLLSGVLLKWMDVNMHVKQTDSTGISAKKLAGSFNDAAFRLYPKMKLPWQSLIDKASVTGGSGVYKGKAITATAGDIAWQPAASKLSVRNFSVLPNLGMQETFAKQGAWQGDYMTIKGESMDITGIQFHQQPGDSSLTVKKIVLDSLSLTTTRDKRMPFKHGAEKPMPVVMINAIKMPLQVDSILVQRSKVTVNEIAIKSEKQGTVPLNDINAVITNFKNTSNRNDSLTMRASARLLNYKISDFYYKEAYGDSLSYFFANVHVSSMVLPEFSTVTIPLASVGVDRGHADTLYARWVGNKHAAVGRMDFYYKGLKIRLLDAKDNTKKRFLLSLGSGIAGLILHKNNDETAQMFFVRDKEKFVFDYWVKTILAGISTSAGIKRNKKMLKRYKSMKAQYSLPVLYD